MRTQRRKGAYRIIGVGLIGVSLIAASFWFLWLVPSFNRFDPEWQRQFTKRAYWAEVQSQIRRYGWKHDDLFTVETYGDYSWAEWIVKKAHAGEEISDCGEIGHKDSALEFITCQNPANIPAEEYADGAVEKAWVEWWEENKTKTQEDWIQDGLAQQGAQVQRPAVAADFEPLLTLLGNTSTNEVEEVRYSVKYNAFRWLRDSGFDPISFAISNATPDSPEMLKNGLSNYAQFVAAFPKHNGIGVLSLGQEPIRDFDRPPMFLTPVVQVPAYCIIGLLLGVGAWLLVLSFRRVEKKTPTSGE